MNLSTEHQRTLLDIARETIRCELGGMLAGPLPDDPELHQPAGCFVSLHELRGHRLRGCVGQLDANAPLAPTVRQMARSVLEDPRFYQFPIMLADLPNLDIELSVLSPLKPAENALDFDLISEGIYLTCGDRSGCFLPQVARETGWPKEKLLDRLCTEKLGLPTFTWKQPEARLSKFTVLLIGPSRF